MLRPTLILVAMLTSAAITAAVALATPKDDWPKIDGELWLNTHDRDETHTGTAKNDELLGGHGDDVIIGGEGHDVIWTDHKASGNTKRQKDRVEAGPGKEDRMSSGSYLALREQGRKQNVPVPGAADSYLPSFLKEGQR